MTNEQHKASSGTALIIEDNDDNRVLISALLVREGYRTTMAITGQAGIDATLKERPELIILDIQLPDMDGVEVLRMIRASKVNGSVPIIAMTSYAMAGDRERLLAEGCTGYIEKPIDPVRVLDQIHAILEKA